MTKRDPGPHARGYRRGMVDVSTRWAQHGRNPSFTICPFTDQQEADGWLAGWRDHYDTAVEAAERGRK